MDERCGEDRGEVVILAMLQIDFGKYHLDVFFLSSIPKDISNHLRAADGGENTKRNNEKVFKKPDELQGVGCKLTPTACSTKKTKQNRRRKATGDE